MPNYKETTGQATSWRRCNRIIIDNPSSGILPKITLFEEDVISLDGQVLSKDSGILSNTFSPDSMVMIRQYPNGELTGEYVTEQHIFELLYSYYMQKAELRDNPSTQVIMG